MTFRLVRLAPLVALALASTGCFATRGDMVVLQNDIATTRAELLAADSARARQLERVMATIQGASDTIRSVNQRFTRFQGDVRTDMNAFSEQLVRVQELLGVSQAELRRLRADVEQRTRSVSTPPATGAPGAAGAPPAGGA
ncbi:MAG TPA: hypothetical protein VFX39_02850, partial [Gemmatimonadaceae bacterium]|nr:hypothetical protein [Gemmatimonadaceae bacterium]